MKHIKQFENLNSQENSLYDTKSYNTIFEEDINEIVKFLLEDLKEFSERTNKRLSTEEIQKEIDKLKKFYSPTTSPYYSAK